MYRAKRPQEHNYVKSHCTRGNNDTENIVLDVVSPGVKVSLLSEQVKVGSLCLSFPLRKCLLKVLFKSKERAFLKIWSPRWRDVVSVVSYPSSRHIIHSNDSIRFRKAYEKLLLNLNWIRLGKEACKVNELASFVDCSITFAGLDFLKQFFVRGVEIHSVAVRSFFEYEI